MGQENNAHNRAGNPLHYLASPGNWADSIMRFSG